MTVKVFSAEYLDELVQQATTSPRHRQHRNIHASYTDPCQRLFNAIEPGSYLRPHCHGTAQGPEMMIAIRGLLALVVFDEDGNIEQVQQLGAGPPPPPPLMRRSQPLQLVRKYRPDSGIPWWRLNRAPSCWKSRPVLSIPMRQDFLRRGLRQRRLPKD